MAALSTIDEGSAGLDAHARSTWSARWKGLKRLPLVSLVILAVLCLAALLGPEVSPHSSEVAQLDRSLQPPWGLDGGTWKHPLGTDQLGRDVATRLAVGARVSLAVGAVALILGCLLGTCVGLIAGYIGGPTDSFLMRLTDIALSFPTILLALVVIAAFGASLTNLVAVIALTLWAPFARQIRGDVLGVRNQAFVEAAESLGAADLRIAVRHVLPNVANSAIVLFTLDAGRVILLESALSFLGLGIQPPSTSWGLMLSEGRDYISSAWWLVTFPGVAIFMTVLALNTAGDWLRDMNDPLRNKR